MRIIFIIAVLIHGLLSLALWNVPDGQVAFKLVFAGFLLGTLGGCQLGYLEIARILRKRRRTG